MDSWEIITPVVRDSNCKTPIYTSAYSANILGTPANSSKYPISGAFDGKFGLVAGELNYVPDAATLYFFVGWNFTVATPINYITWYYYYPTTILPTAFVVEGSNNLGTWTVLASFASDTWESQVKYKFPIPESSYKAYRMRVTACKNIPAYYHYFGELELCYMEGGSLTKLQLSMPVTII